MTVKADVKECGRKIKIELLFYETRQNTNKLIHKNKQEKMSHKIQTQQICAAIRLAAASSSRFETTPQGTIESYDDDTYEFWSFGFPREMGEKLRIQSCTCVCCGNYLVSPMGDMLPKNVSCNCEHGFPDIIEFEKIQQKQTKKYKEMNKWDGFDAFVDVVLPEGGPDYLCEDVVGEIMRFL